jgi:L-gulonolactone oxidase
VGDRRWSNWAGNQQCSPASIERPRTEAELVAIVRAAAERGQRVKVVGAGHSFTDIACTDGILVDLTRYGDLLAFDPDTLQVTVQAGMRLSALNDALAERGAALENLGDIAYQSVAGAIATATHGTGRAFGNLATRVVGLRLIAGDGSVRSCSAEVDTEVFSVARVGIGALGVVSEVTIQCVAAFNLHAVEEPQRVDAVLEAWDELLVAHDHFEFFWVPNTGWALTKRNRRTTDPVQERSRWVRWRNEVLYDNVAFGAANRVARRRPSATRRLGKALPSAGRVEYTEPSHAVFASTRLVHFYEMEYAVPVEVVPEALTRVRALVKDEGLPLLFPVEVRAVAADDIALSTATGRTTGYVAVHVYRGTPFRRYFEGVEAIMDDYDGRPHWGKMHFQTAATLAARYPRWDEFAAVRDRLDPARTFANAYLDRVLGT